MTLKQEDIDSFNKNGYLVLSDLLSPTTKAALQGWSNEVYTWPNVPNQHMPYDEYDAKSGTQFLCRTENFVNYHKGFGELLRSTQLIGTLEQLSREPMVLFKEKINYKLPGGGAFDAHTDAPAYQHLGNVSHLTILLAVQPSTLDNGCLEVVRGSHKQKDIPFRPDKCIEESWCAKQDWAPVPMNTGDVLVFGSFLAHRSGPNGSSHGRAAVYATYNALADGGDKHDSYYEHRRRIFPPTFEQKEGENYEEGRALFAFGTPMLSV